MGGAYIYRLMVKDLVVMVWKVECCAEGVLDVRKITMRGYSRWIRCVFPRGLCGMG